MSWRVLNEVLILASIDPVFLESLRTNAAAAIRKYQFSLTDEELRVLQNAQATDVYELSDIVMRHFGAQQKGDDANTQNPPTE